MFLGFQLQVWYFIENIVFQAPVCIIWDFFEPLRTVIDHFSTLWSNFVHFCLFWTQCDLERHRKMNSKILFSLLGLFYGMSRGAFRGVSFFFENLVCGRASLMYTNGMISTIPHHTVSYHTKLEMNNCSDPVSMFPGVPVPCTMVQGV